MLLAKGADSVGVGVTVYIAAKIYGVPINARSAADKSGVIAFESDVPGGDCEHAYAGFFCFVGNAEVGGDDSIVINYTDRALGVALLDVYYLFLTFSTVIFYMSRHGALRADYCVSYNGCVEQNV